jgi:hypothetical protein
MEETPLLQPNELYNQRRSKDSSRLRAYNKILEQIHHRIRVISKLPQSPCYLIYTVPPFIFGLPKLDLEDCMVYLVYQMRQGGFDVRFTYPNMMYISWVHHEKSYLVEQSPIMLAMMGSAERNKAEQEHREKEKRRRVKTDGMFHDKPQSVKPKKVSFISNKPYIPPAFQESSAPPKAASYVPPSSFLQNITNPTPQVTRPQSVPEYFKR